MERARALALECGARAAFGGWWWTVLVVVWFGCARAHLEVLVQQKGLRRARAEVVRDRRLCLYERGRGRRRGEPEEEEGEAVSSSELSALQRPPLRHLSSRAQTSTTIQLEQPLPNTSCSPPPPLALRALPHRPVARAKGARAREKTDSTHTHSHPSPSPSFWRAPRARPIAPTSTVVLRPRDPRLDGPRRRPRGGRGGRGGRGR
jgi:hypothetical protein